MHTMPNVASAMRKYLEEAETLKHFTWFNTSESTVMNLRNMNKKETNVLKESQTPKQLSLEEAEDRVHP